MKRPLPTCIVSPEAIGPFTNGGVGTAAYRLAELLTQNGVAVTLLYTGEVMKHVRPDWRQHYYESRFIDLVILDEWWEGHESRELFPLGYGGEEAEAMRSECVREFLTEREFAVVYFQEFMGLGLRTIQAKRSGLAFARTRMVVWCHSSFLWSLQGNRRVIGRRSHLIREAHERLSAQQADVAAAPSKYMCRLVEESWQLPVVRSLPLWHRDANAANRERTTFRNFRHLVFFGRLERRKGLDLLLAALRTSPVLQARIERLTFLGRQIPIDGASARDYISAALGTMPFSWEIVDGLNTDEALAWMSERPDILAIAPSVQDNFPFAVLEMFLRRIPFLSTRVGGIPEIVGNENANELLMAPTAAAVRDRLEFVLEKQNLTIDFVAGYDPTAAADRILAFHQDLLDSSSVDFRKTQGSRWGTQVDLLVVQAGLVGDLQATIKGFQTIPDSQRGDITVLLTNAATPSGLEVLGSAVDRESRDVGVQIRLTSLDAESTGLGATTTDRDLLVLRAGEVLRAGSVDDLIQATRGSDDAITSGYVIRAKRGPSDERVVQRPLGMVPELGFLEETMATTPCLIRASARADFEALLLAHEGSLHPTLLELGLIRGHVGVIPRLIAEGGIMPPTTPEDRDKVRLTAVYQRHVGRLREDLLFPLLFPPVVQDPSAPKAAAYAALASADESLLENYLRDQRPDDSVAIIVDRLAPLIDRWSRQPPRLYLFGAGEHSKVILGLFPVLWRWIAAFIDSRRTVPFLGKPCIYPRDVKQGPETVVLYSSRQHEQAMRSLMPDTGVTNVLIYNPVPVTANETVQ